MPSNKKWMTGPCVDCGTQTLHKSHCEKCRTKPCKGCNKLFTWKYRVIAQCVECTKKSKNKSKTYDSSSIHC